MVIVAALAAILDELTVTVGAVDDATTWASWTALPLERALVDTEPFSAPTAAGLRVNVTVSEVVVAAVTRPEAEPTNVTVLLVATGLNPKPLMTKLVPLIEKLAELLVTTGLMVAT